MAAAQKTIDHDVRTALASIEWEGNAAKLTCGQLDRKLYVKVNDVLESLGGKWNRKAKAHLFEGNAQDELEAAIETGVSIRAADLRQIFGEFETPDDLADALASRFPLLNFQPNVLEPSAGSGQLLRALERRHEACYHAVAIEIQEKHRKKLTGYAGDVVIGDFLQMRDSIAGLCSFHYIAMNPPFARQADIDHVLHAWKFLASGGRLVAIMSPGWTFRENAKSRLFREFVNQHGEWSENPPQSFRVSGTNVNSVMVTLEKP